MKRITANTYSFNRFSVRGARIGDVSLEGDFAYIKERFSNRRREFKHLHKSHVSNFIGTSGGSNYGTRVKDR